MFYTFFVFIGGFRRLRGNGEARSYLNNIFIKLYRRVYQHCSDLWVSGLVENKQSHEGCGGGMPEGPLDAPLYMLYRNKINNLSVEMLRSVKYRHLIICPLLVLHYKYI